MVVCKGQAAVPFLHELYRLPREILYKMAGELEEPDIESSLKTRTGKPKLSSRCQVRFDKATSMVKAGEG
jgi:hypothetical protein